MNFRNCGANLYFRQTGQTGSAVLTQKPVWKSPEDSVYTEDFAINLQLTACPFSAGAILFSVLKQPKVSECQQHFVVGDQQRTRPDFEDDLCRWDTDEVTATHSVLFCCCSQPCAAPILASFVAIT